MGCIVLTRNMFHLAALLRYTAVKYTEIYFISIYVERLRFIIVLVFSQHKLYHNPLDIKDSCDCLIIAVDCRNT
jgi:hypothetical protein